MNPQKVCNDEVNQFAITQFHSLNRLSQESARLLFDCFSFSDPVWETEGRVDLIVSSESEIYRIEIKFISKLDENRYRLINGIKKTRSDIKSKNLDFLLVTTLAKKFSMHKDFKRFEGYCLLGILVSKVEIEETPPEKLATEILEEGRSLLEQWDEFGMMYQEQLLQHSKDIEKLSELNHDQTKHITAVEDKVDSLENKVETKVDALENKVENVENEIKQLQNDVNSLHDKFDDFQKNVMSILERLVGKKNGNE